MSDRNDTYRAVFTHRNYLLLWIGQTISQIGDAITVIAVPLLIYQLTQSPMQLTFAFVLEAIPWIVIGPMAGVLLDRMDRRRVMIAADVSRAVLIVSLCVIDHVVWIYAVGFFSQVMAAVFAPARSAVIPELIPRALYVKAIGLSHTSYQFVQVLGPAAASLLIGWLGGTRPAFLLDSATFLLAALLTMAVRFPKAAPVPADAPPPPSFWAAFREGVTFLRDHPVMRFVTAINLLKAAVSAAVLIGVLLYVKTQLGVAESVSDRWYGLAMAAIAGGTILGTWLIGLWEKRLVRFQLIFGGLMLQGAAYLLVLLHPGPVALLILLFAAGLAASGALTPVSAYYAEQTPNEIRGRVYSATNSLLRVSSLISYGLAGVIGEQYGAGALLIGSGLLLLACTPLLTWTLAQKRDALH